MNFKYVRQQLVISTLVGVVVFSGTDLVGEAAEVEEDPSSYEELTGGIIDEDKVKIYGEFSFGYVDGYAYIYSSPSVENDWIGKLYADNKVTILWTDDTWAEIQSGNVHGYVKLEYLLEEEESIIREQEIVIKWAVVDTWALNVRTGPSTEYRIVDTVLEGTKLLIIGELKDGWQIVQYGDEICYVSGNYIIEETEFSYAETKEEEVERLADYERLMEATEDVVETISTDVEEITVSNEQITSGDSTSAGQSVVDYAIQFIGNPYVWGGTDLVNGADCSGFVQSVYAHFGVSLPRTSSEQRSAGVAVSYDEIQVGDIICYDGHVGIYIGSGEIVNAIGSKYGIGISSATYANIITIRRVI